MLPALLALLNSTVVDYLYKIMLGRTGYALYRNGALAKVPVPVLTDDQIKELNGLGLAAWSLRRQMDIFNETSHAFVIPLPLLEKHYGFDLTDKLREYSAIKKQIDDVALSCYGIDEDEILQFKRMDVTQEKSEEETDCNAFPIPCVLDAVAGKGEGLMSWAVGVAFGRFGLTPVIEGAIDDAPKPIAPLPAISPAMMSDSQERFAGHRGVLVDDAGCDGDLPTIVESVLERVDIPSPDDLRRWLQKDFFKQHLAQYSKSHRKAPIYWPLVTSSGRYTLWVYYPELDDQTLYTAVNDFLEPKLKSLDDLLNALRVKSSRTATEERELEKQQELQQELIELRDTILEIAPNYKPNHDDGVQITAAPLWPLFRHKPWQKVLKDTWEKLEAGEYDWAHLAYSYWPDRVREKCKTDKSLAIAHDLEELYEEPAA